MKKIGAGNTAEVFEYAEGKICKLYFSYFDKATAHREFENTKLINELGIPSPKVFEEVSIDGRNGFVEEYLLGSTILNQLLQGNNTEELLVKMANLHENILSHHTTKCASYKDTLRSFLIGKLPENDSLYAEIENLPDGDNVCHGDFHPDNVWQSKDGKILVIDFMNICYGPKLYDIARSYFLMTQGELPKGMSEEEKIELQKMRTLLGNQYLSLMKVTEADIEKYFNIVKACRAFELQQV